MVACNAQECVCEIHEGDVGTIFNTVVKDCGVDVTLETGDSVDFLFRKPNGQTVRKLGTIVSPPSSVVRYITKLNDLDQPGRWRLQLDLNLPSQDWEGKSCVVQFDVEETIDA